MRYSSCLLLIAGCALAIVACERRDLPTSPRAQTSTGDGSGAALERACASVDVKLRGHGPRAVVLTPIIGGACGSHLQIAMEGTPELDGEGNVIGLPLVLRNGGTGALTAPARLYAWEDSLIVVDPPGLSRNKHSDGYLAFVNPDSAIDQAAASFAGADVWRFDTLLAPAGQPQTLAAGGSSLARQLDVSVKGGVHEFTLALEAEAPPANVPAAPILVLTDSSVVGTPATDTVALIGDSIAYEFVPAPGYTNVRVRLDGQAAPAAGMVTASAVGHVLSVSADPVLLVPQRAAAVYAAARAVLTAGDVPTAYQAYLDAADAFIQGSPDPEMAAHDLSVVNAIAFDFLHDEAALRHVDSVLAGYSFRLGPDPLGDPGGTPILNPSDTSVVILGQPARGPRISRSTALAQTDTIEPTVFLYVNGIFTEPSDAGITADLVLNPLIRSIPGFASRNIAVRLSYNPTWKYQQPRPDQKRFDCVAIFGNRLDGGTIGANSFPDFMAQCTRDSTLRDLSDQDFIESVREVYSILANTDAPDAGADMVGNDIQRDRRAGRHVIVVAHSQGNLLTNKAIHFLATHHLYSPQTDSSCVGVVSLASPTSGRWDVPPHNLARIVVDGDLVPLTGGNFTPRISTVLSRQIDLRAKVLDIAFGAGEVYRAYKGFTTLHAVNTSYLRFEAAQAVIDASKQVYGACTVHGIASNQPSVTATVGSRFAAAVTFTNSFGDPIPRTLGATAWSSSDSSIVVPTGGGLNGGIFRGLAIGEASVTATRGAHSATIPIAIVSGVPPKIVGTWGGTWSNQTTGDSGTIHVTISGSSSLDLAMTISWTDQAGVTWHALSTDDPPHVLSDIDGLPGAAQSWVSFLDPTQPDNPFHFFRFFMFKTTAENANAAVGISSLGTSESVWDIQLMRQ